MIQSTIRRYLRPVALATLATHTLGLGLGLAQTALPAPAVQVPAVGAAAGAAVQVPTVAATTRQTVQQVNKVVTQVNPALGKELKLLESQIDDLIKGVGGFEKTLKPVVQSATKVVNVVDSYPQQVTAFKSKYDIPKNPTLSQEAQGIGRFVKDKLGVSPQQSAQATQFLKKSPVFEQFKQPFQPSSIMLAVGATAGINLFAQMQSGEGVDLAKAVGFVSDKSFWGGLVGSGVGYGLMAAVATSLFPAGAGLLPVLAPMFAGMTGSIFGWEVGAGLTNGESVGDTLKKLDPTKILGQAAGTTVGLLVGANVGAMIGGTLGAVAGPVGAIAGAMLMAKVGARVGEAVKGLFKGDATEMNAALVDAGVVVDKLKKAEKALGEIMPPSSLSAASMANEGLPLKLKDEYDQAYKDLTAALKANDRATAHLKVQYLNKLSARYQQAVGESLQRHSQGQ